MMFSMSRPALAALVLLMPALPAQWPELSEEEPLDMSRDNSFDDAAGGWEAAARLDVAPETKKDA